MKSQSRPLGNHLSLSSLMGLLHTCNVMSHMDISCKWDSVMHPFANFPNTFLHPHVHGLPSAEVPSQGYAITHFNRLLADARSDTVNPHACAHVCSGMSTHRAAGEGSLR